MTGFLPNPKAETVADQCREMGIEVGDTIVGREKCDDPDNTTWLGVWNEARLTLLWLGKEEAVWLEQTRNSHDRKWTEPCESAQWNLGCRPWRKVAV